jgi:hypothetical protein
MGELVFEPPVGSGDLQPGAPTEIASNPALSAKADKLKVLADDDIS